MSEKNQKNDTQSTFSNKISNIFIIKQNDSRARLLISFPIQYDIKIIKRLVEKNDGKNWETVT
jgi:hypothetical protein